MAFGVGTGGDEGAGELEERLEIWVFGEAEG